MNQKMMLTRAVSGLPMTIIVILLIERRFMSIPELCVWSNSNDDYVRKAVALLGPEGMGLCAVSVRERGEKFIGMASGYQQRFPGLDELFLDSAKSESGELSAVMLIPDSVKSESGISEQPEMASKPIENAILEPKNAPDSAKSESGTGSIRLMIESESNQKTEIINQSEPELSGNFPNVETILENLPMIFGDTLRLADIPAKTSPVLMLAWVAKLYQDISRPDSKLRNPCGVLKARLNAREKRKLHLELLPDNFLHAVGLRVDRPQQSRRVNALDALDDYQVEPEREKRECANTIPENIQVAWATALEAMRQELARSQFQTWVEPTRILGWDGKTLEIGARSEYAANWLESHVSELAMRTLSELGLFCAIRFVVSEDE